MNLLAGQCHESIGTSFFTWITFSQAPDNTKSVIGICSKLLGDNCKSRWTTGVKVATTPRVTWPPVSWSCQYLREFLKNSKSGAWRKMIHEKNLKRKIARNCPFKSAFRYRRWCSGQACWPCSWFPYWPALSPESGDAWSTVGSKQKFT